MGTYYIGGAAKKRIAQAEKRKGFWLYIYGTIRTLVRGYARSASAEILAIRSRSEADGNES